MQGSQTHLSDEELLLFSDRELSRRDATIAREHVALCEGCRRRLTELEGASAGFADLHAQETQARSPQSLRSRMLLKARLSEDSRRQRRSWLGGSTGFSQLAGACAALLVVAGSTWAIHHVALERSRSEGIKSEAVVLPRRTLTPGSVRAVEIHDLCRAQDLDNDPPVNPAVAQAVFKEYGLQDSAKGDYELDFLITPALGGAGDIENLWPEPYSSTWNARVKDQLEDHLHQLVCSGKVQLATAQNDIASDWISAYKRYFNTDKPQPGPPTVAVRVHRRNSFRADQVGGQHASRVSGDYDLALNVQPSVPR